MRALANPQAGAGFTSRLLKKPHMLRLRFARLASTYWSVRLSSSNFARLAS